MPYGFVIFNLILLRISLYTMYLYGSEIKTCYKHEYEFIVFIYI